MGKPAPNKNAVPLAGPVHQRTAGRDVSTGQAILAREDREQPDDHRLVGHRVEVVCDGARATGAEPMATGPPKKKKGGRFK